MTPDIIHKDNEPTTRDKLSKDSDDWIAASKLYVSAKISHCCRKRSLFEKGSERSDIQEKQDIRVGCMQKADWNLSPQV
jgi:hypothetical protein